MSVSEEKAAVPKEAGEGKEKWSLFRFVGRTHPSFLGAFKETQPLSELAALSIIVAAFASDQPVAREYAIVAGAMFLLAFIFSTAVVLGAKGMMVELYSYVVTGLGVAFLGGVIIEYVIALKLLGNALGIAGDIVSGVLQITLVPAFASDLRKSLRERKRSYNWYLLTATSGFVVVVGIYNGLFWLVYEPYRELVMGTSGSATFSYTLFGAVGGIVAIRLLSVLYRRRELPTVAEK